jgi:hypothetical protein
MREKSRNLGSPALTVQVGVRNMLENSRTNQVIDGFNQPVQVLAIGWMFSSLEASTSCLSDLGR